MLPRSHQLTLHRFSNSVLLAEGRVPDVPGVGATSFFRESLTWHGTDLSASARIRRRVSHDC